MTPSQLADAFPSRVGGYFLAFPFNEVTRKCSSGCRLDMKGIVHECQRLLKERISGSKASRQLQWPMLAEESR
jgi:hypothetical protein